MKKDSLLLNWDIELTAGSKEANNQSILLAKKLAPHIKPSLINLNFARKILKTVRNKNKKPLPAKVKKKKIKKPKLTHDFYKTWEWKKKRYEALVKYGAVCMLCGATKLTATIYVDHIKPIRFYPELSLDINNLQILCQDCNMGKSYHHTDDWRGGGI